MFAFVVVTTFKPDSSGYESNYINMVTNKCRVSVMEWRLCEQMRLNMGQI